MRKLLSTIMFVAVAVVAMAKEITPQEAVGVAYQFLNKHNSMLQRANVPSEKLSLVHTKTHTNGDVPLYYVFNQGEAGFVVVAADDNIVPVIGYSDSGAFDADNMPDNFKFFLDCCNKTIEEAIDNGIDLNKKRGQRVRQGAKSNFAPFVKPLLGDIKFTQSAPYNMFCPKQNGENSAVGCVALSMGQVMTYYQHPQKGEGKFEYTTDTHEFDLEVDFSAATYKWENILHEYKKGSYTEEQAEEVAELLYHCGVAAEMDYSVGGSATHEVYAARALATYFGYDKGIRVCNRNYYTQDEWEDLIKQELNEERPIIYSGVSALDGGHTFNCDGYDENDMFHINWGWGGYCNGYFDLRLLDSDITNSEDLHYGFALYQSAIIGIQPSKDSGSKETTYQLELEDGIYYDDEDVTFAVCNYGIASFNGKIGLAYYDGNDEFVDVCFESKDITLSILEYKDYILSLDSEIPAGSAKVVPVYKEHDSEEWIPVPAGKNTPNYLVIENGTDLKNQEKFEESPIEVLSLKPIGNVYQNRTARFDAKIKNISDAEYYGFIVVYATNYDDENEEVESEYIPVELKAGEEADYEIHIENMDVNLGDFYCYIAYDSYDGYLTYIYGDYYYSEEVDFPVVAAPTGEPKLTLVDNLSFYDVDRAIFNSASTPIATAKISNTGAYAQGYVTAVILDENYDVEYSFGTKKLMLDKSENTKISFICDFLDLEEGEYYLQLQFYNPFLFNPKWKIMEPSGKNLLSFTIDNDMPIGLDDIDETKVSVYPTSAKDIVNIASEELVRSVSVYDVAGQQIMHKEYNAQTVSLNVSSLSSGMYLMIVETEKGQEVIKINKI